jgi:hypothetical protein
MSSALAKIREYSASADEGDEMSDEDLQKTRDALAALQKELTSSPEKARAFLVKYGFLTPDGELTEPYRQGA